MFSTARQRIQAAFSPAGAGDFAVVIPYIQIYVRGPRAALLRPGPRPRLCR